MPYTDKKRLFSSSKLKKNNGEIEIFYDKKKKKKDYVDGRGDHGAGFGWFLSNLAKPNRTG